MRGRFGHRLFATRTGRRLLAPRSLAVIEREYLRFGMVGIFLSRFLPGIRAVVPPFAGLVRLGLIRTFVPMAIASMIWYGGITLMGALLGAQWQRILGILEGVNRTMGIVAAVLVAAPEVANDLGDCDAIEMLKRVQDACEKVLSELEGAVIQSGFSGGGYQYSNGISVFFPWSLEGYEALRAPCAFCR